ncbi:Lovastatin diketide synthase LovF [Cytospora mali]|uniref:Lovastatin diketide synthase LovF n=1 Tax=Cytospora mali TaxID=578113 RepID=A0A194VB20_CYTMA|nr:Lovastatin diketide synthase LovF [Valsa mali var. pyri (nom. inval.)]
METEAPKPANGHAAGVQSPNGDGNSIPDTTSTRPSGPTPIAIVGMACRLSGNVCSSEDFWEMICRGRNGWSGIPEQRFSTAAYSHPNPEKKGAFNARGGYFLEQDPSMFDAPFFNITRAEAEAMDPQQRLLLECTYEALENAGIPKETLVGKNVGVFVGGAASDYRLGTLRDLDHTPMFDATGNHQSIQSGRISHYFDFRGPGFTVDTACSSSLYALHQAVLSLRNGECEQAIVAACHLNLQPGDWVSMSLSRLFSDQGMTFAFDNRAKSGFARGEGAGVLILKPLANAIEANDKIRSVIVNTGVNQDGKTVGITSPNGQAQEKLMREVYARAGISPQDTGFVEAHGTGTKVGDPIEATAIHNVFQEGRTASKPLLFGSVKSNIGHLENASGLASVIKATMMLEKGFVLPNTNFKTPNESIPLADWKMKVPTLQQPWPSDKQYVSVNNFGFGGSNAHCVLAKPPRRSGPALPKPTYSGYEKRLFVLSASDETSAKAMMNNLVIFLEQHPEIFQKHLLRNLAYTLSQRRSQLSWRVGIVAGSSSKLGEILSSSEAKPIRASQHPLKIAFVYTGQGAQWYAMGRELIESHPVFSRTIHAADTCLKDLGADFSLLEELLRDKTSSRVGEAHISQPVCVAIQLALTDLLSSWGISPSSVTGHSSGEISAAYAAGVLSLEAALSAAYHRGQAVLKMKARHPDLKGAMMAVGAGAKEVKPLTQSLQSGRAVVACENSPNSVTVSGDEAAIDELAGHVESRQLFNRKLRVDVAYHSPHMEVVASDYYEAIKNTTSPTASGPGKCEFFSSLRGTKVDDVSSVDASYWVKNLTHPVLFATSLTELCASSLPDVIVEIGPHSALEGPVKQTLKAMGAKTNKVAYFSALVRNQCATTTSMKLAANLWMKGYPLNMANINLEDPNVEPPTLVDDLKPYPWNRQRYWVESRLSQQHRIKAFPRHDLLGNMADFSNELAPTWTNVLRTNDLPWLRDHKMQGLTTFPFAGFVSMAIEAAAQRASQRSKDFKSFKLREVQVKRPLLMEDDAEYEVMLQMSPYAEGTRSYSDEWDEFRISSYEEGKGWTEHSRGLISVRKDRDSNQIYSAARHWDSATKKMEAAVQVCDEEVSVSTFYSELVKKGAIYGPTFRRITSIQAHHDFSVASIDADAMADTTAVMPMEYQTPYHVHPALLDQILQLSFPILGAGRASIKMGSLYMPSAIQELELQRDISVSILPGDKFHVTGHGCPDLKNPQPTDFDMIAMLARPGVDHGVQIPAVSLLGLCMTPVKNDILVSDAPRELCFKLQWEPLVPEDGREVHASETEGVHTEAISEKDCDCSVDSSCLSPRDSGYVGSPPTRPETASGGTPDSPTEAMTDSGILMGVHKGLFKDDLQLNILEALAEKAWAEKSIIIVPEGHDVDPVATNLVDTQPRHPGMAPAIHSISDAAQFDLSQTHIIVCELDNPILANLTADTFSQLQKILTESAGVLWVTKGAYLNATHPTKNMSVGLCRTIRSERAAAVATLDLDPDSRLRDSEKVGLILQAFCQAFDEKDATDMEFAEKDGALVIPRIVNDDAMDLTVHREVHQDTCAPYLQDFVSSRRLKMTFGTTGALDSLYFYDDGSAHLGLGEDEIEIEVKATGMNFKDVVIAMGQLSQPYIGIESAGIVSRIGANVKSLAVGDRVCAMSHGAYSTFARCPATSAAVIPASMSFEAAASIPVVYCTAYYGLVELGRLSEGEKVLVHAAAGGVGQAAIQIAKKFGVEIYATVGSLDKKKFIMETYGIPEDHIFSSRDNSFGPAIREATGGSGVDIVLNSLAGDLLRESWDCIAHFGRFIEIGKRDITSNTRLEMAKFNNNATFSSVDLTLLANEKPKKMNEVFRQVMALFTDDVIKTITPTTVFGISEVEKAFRLLQSGKTMGKLVVVPRPGEQVNATHPLPSTNLLRADATYLIIGGTGGLGRSMSRWMVSRGAKNIVLLSRRGQVEGAVAELIQDLKQSAGANIVVKACDVGEASDVLRLTETCLVELPPIAGVIHAGMVLRDVLFEKMTFEQYQAVIRSKTTGTWNIHNALLSLSTRLDFFIMLSSAAGIVGNRGQAAYAAANTFLDSFARYRQRLGLPAAAIDLTAVEDVGYLADSGAGRQDEVLKNLGGESMGEAEVLALIATAIKNPTEFPDHCLTGVKLGEDPERLPYYASDAKFEHLRNTVLSRSTGGTVAAAQVSIDASLSAAKTDEEKANIVITGLAGKLAAILMISSDDLDVGTPITKYGLDSLNAIELRNWITKELGVNLQVLQLLTSGSLTNLASVILKKRGT